MVSIACAPFSFSTAMTACHTSGSMAVSVITIILCCGPTLRNGTCKFFINSIIFVEGFHIDRRT